jgi:hypothetical protein
MQLSSSRSSGDMNQTALTKQVFKVAQRFSRTAAQLSAEANRKSNFGGFNQDAADLREQSAIRWSLTIIR